MATRYDDYTPFHNPTGRAFVGRWEQEDYIIEAGATESFPRWLARHFAKRLCDQVMIKEHGEPLRPDHKKRQEFMAKCLPGTKLEMIGGSQPKTTKEQIEADRENIVTSKDDRIARLKAELAELESDPDTEPEDMMMAEDGPEQADDEDEDSLEDEEPIDDDEPLTPQESEKRAAAAIRKESEKEVKAFEEGKLKNKPNPVGRKQRTVKTKDEKPVFDGDVSKADIKLKSSFGAQLAQEGE